jgi:serine/threonine-protein kinase
MASVWQAHDEARGCDVAVKIVPAARDDQLYARFLREARLIRKFSHRNIVSVFDAGEMPGEGLLFIAMELLHGSPLSNHLSPGEPMAPEDVFPVLIQVCRGLEAAHAAGVIHRDIKPENIFLAILPGEGVVPKILDFGLSTAHDRAAQTRITADGQVLGTPMYMSPEQAIARQDLTPASDVWSMGVVLYEAMTGKLPFFGTTLTAVLDAIVAGEPAPIPPSVDVRTRAILGRCLQKEPARRYPDAAALRADMERTLEARAREKTATPAGDACSTEDEVEPPSSLADPERIAAEPPTTRRDRTQRQALGRAGNPVLIALVAAGLCGAAVLAVPRAHVARMRAAAGVARVAHDRVARLAEPR